METEMASWQFYHYQARRDLRVVNGELVVVEKSPVQT
jgi:hypothetical protein